MFFMPLPRGADAILQLRYVSIEFVQAKAIGGGKGCHSAVLPFNIRDAQPVKYADRAHSAAPCCTNFGPDPISTCGPGRQEDNQLFTARKLSLNLALNAIAFLYVEDIYERISAHIANAARHLLGNPPVTPTMRDEDAIGHVASHPQFLRNHNQRATVAGSSSPSN